MDRIYSNYKLWEDFKNGMYETTCYMDSSMLAQECAQTLSCPEWLEESMMFCIINWPVSTAQHLSNKHRNRQAWLGQAACCMVHGAPEYVTKQGWHMLSELDQKRANKVADKCIEFWEKQIWPKLI